MVRLAHVDRHDRRHRHFVARLEKKRAEASAKLLGFAAVRKRNNCATCPDAVRINRGCTLGLREPEVWDYDPEGHKIKSTGQVVPTTCPVLTHEGGDLYFRCLRLHSLLDRGHLPLSAVTSVMYDLAYEVAAMESKHGND